MQIAEPLVLVVVHLLMAPLVAEQADKDTLAELVIVVLVMLVVEAAELDK